MISAKDNRESCSAANVARFDCPSGDGAVTLAVLHVSTPAPQATLFLLHGLSEHMGRWMARAQGFAAAGIDVWMMDHRGHGESGGLRTHLDHPSQFIDDAVHVWSHIKALVDVKHPFFLLGHSMGGLIAAGVASRASVRDEFERVVLSAPALCTDQKWILQALAPILGFLLPKQRVAADITGAQLSSDPAVGEAYFADPHVIACTGITLGMGKNLLAMIETVGAPENLKKIRAKTLVVHGEDDTVVPIRASELVAATIPNVTFQRLAHTRHEPHNEACGDQLYADIVAFLQ